MRDFEPEAPSWIMLGLQTHRNCGIIHFCCFKSLNFRVVMQQYIINLYLCFFCLLVFANNFLNTVLVCNRCSINNLASEWMNDMILLLKVFLLFLWRDCKLSFLRSETVLETFYSFTACYIMSYAYMNLTKFLIEFDVLLFLMHKACEATILLN